MFDDDLENTSPDGSGAKEGEGGTRGPEGAKGPLVTRRNFIAACPGGRLGDAALAARGEGRRLRSRRRMVRLGRQLGDPQARQWELDRKQIGLVLLGVRPPPVDRRRRGPLGRGPVFQRALRRLPHAAPRRLPGLERPERSSPLALRIRRHAPAVLVQRGHDGGPRLGANQPVPRRRVRRMVGDAPARLRVQGQGLLLPPPARARPATGFGLSAGFYNVSVGEYAGGLWDDWENCYVWIHTNGGYSCADWNYQGAAFENAGRGVPGRHQGGPGPMPPREQMGPVRRGVEGHQRLRERKRPVPRRLRRRDVVGNVPLVLGLLRGDLPGLVRQRRRRRLERQGAHAQPLSRAQARARVGRAGPA